MQEDVLHLILKALENGQLIARKSLVMYIVETLAKDYPQVSKVNFGLLLQRGFEFGFLDMRRTRRSTGISSQLL